MVLAMLRARMPQQIIRWPKHLDPARHQREAGLEHFPAVPLFGAPTSTARDDLITIPECRGRDLRHPGVQPPASHAAVACHPEALACPRPFGPEALWLGISLLITRSRTTPNTKSTF